MTTTQPVDVGDPMSNSSNQPVAGASNEAVPDPSNPSVPDSSSQAVHDTSTQAVTKSPSQPTTGGQDESEESRTVLYGKDDVAQNEFLDRMTVGVAGRVVFERIYVRTPNMKRSTLKYNVANDAPKDNQTLSILSTTEEREGRPETSRFLVVGFVLANNPTQYSDKATGRARDKERAEARKARGILPTGTNLLRAMVPETESINPGSIKYYVACHQVHGLCSMRVITGDAIFFYSEIWGDISTKAEIKFRRASLGSACKLHASKNKKPAERAIIPINSAAKPTTSNDLGITRAVNAASSLAFGYSAWTISQDRDSLATLKTIADRILADHTPKRSNEGTVAFYDLENEMEKECADKFIEEVKHTYPNICTLDPELILVSHKIMRTLEVDYALPYNNLALFLELIHSRAKAGWDPTMLVNVVKQILETIELVDKTRTISLGWTDSNTVKDEGLERSYREILSAVRQTIREIKEHISAQTVALREQHGGVALHLTIQELMLKIGNCVDMTALMANEEQILATHAEQLATGNSSSIEYLGELEDSITLVLGRE